MVEYVHEAKDEERDVKTVELRRHTDNDGDELSDDGVQQARQVGATLTPPYDLFVSSGAQRATQTVAIWQEAVGDTSPIQQEPGLRSDQEDRWKRAYERAGSGDLASLRDADPELVDEDSAALGAALGSVFERIPPDGSSLACGHSPTNEAAVLGLTGVMVEPMGKGAGVRVVQADDGGWRVQELP